VAKLNGKISLDKMALLAPKAVLLVVLVDGDVDEAELEGFKARGLVMTTYADVVVATSSSALGASSIVVSDGHMGDDNVARR
jgi:hypothetical protein